MRLSQKQPLTLFLMAPIRINLSREGRQEGGQSVGARVVRSGWEGLHGRPRPVSLAHILGEHDRLPSTGDHEGPPRPTSTTLAPTAFDGLFLGLCLLPPF